MKEFEGILHVKEGPFKGARIKFDLCFDEGYPFTIPKIMLYDKLPHPLIDNDNFLHVEHIIRLFGDQVPISSVLVAITKAFSKKTLQGIDPEKCINFALKHQYICYSVDLFINPSIFFCRIDSDYGAYEIAARASLPTS